MSEHLCECGCGKRVSRPTNRFIHGHHQRGVKFTDEQRQNQSEAQKRVWENASPERRTMGPMPEWWREKIRAGSRKGNQHWNWNEGRNFRGGYVYLRLPGHPMADIRGYVAEHRLVMSEHLGRTLGKGEDVHHINGDRLDNRLDNLELIGHDEHAARKVQRVYVTAIAALLATGMTVEEAAEGLHVSVETVRKYVEGG